MTTKSVFDHQCNEAELSDTYQWKHEPLCKCEVPEIYKYDALEYTYLLDSSILLEPDFIVTARHFINAFTLLLSLFKFLPLFKKFYVSSSFSDGYNWRHKPITSINVPCRFKKAILWYVRSLDELAQALPNREDAPKWNSKPTCLIKIPKFSSSDVLRYAEAIDSGSGLDIFINFQQGLNKNESQRQTKFSNYLCFVTQVFYWLGYTIFSNEPNDFLNKNFLKRYVNEYRKSKYYLLVYPYENLDSFPNHDNYTWKHEPKILVSVPACFKTEILRYAKELDINSRARLSWEDSLEVSREAPVVEVRGVEMPDKKL